MTTLREKTPIAEDVTPKRLSIKRKKYLALALLLSATALAWWAYKNVYESYRLHQSLNDAITILTRKPSHAEYLSQFKHLSDAERAHYAADNIFGEDLEVSATRRSEIIKDALQLGKKLKYTRILTLEAVLMRRGDLPGFNENEIKEKFQDAFSIARERVKSSDPKEKLAYIELIRVARDFLDEKPTVPSLINVLNELSDYDFEEIYLTYHKSNTELSSYFSERHKRGLKIDTLMILVLELHCLKSDPEQKTLDKLIGKTEAQSARLLRNDRQQRLAECAVDILGPFGHMNQNELKQAFINDVETEKIVALINQVDLKSSANQVNSKKGNLPNLDLIDDQGKGTDSIAIEHPLLSKSKSASHFSERTYPGRTGYVSGEPILHSQGLSTFEIDNTGTTTDAIVRIYLNGKKPASRSMLVKAGDKFTAKNISPGSYTLRYKFPDSNKVFEAKTLFTVTEVSTETGIRTSKITVTLYKTKDGNLRTAEVSEDDF